MSHKSEYILGLTGFETGLAVSLLKDQTVEFALEEDKLHRYKGLGLVDLKRRRCKAIDLALSRIGGTIEDIETVVYVPPMTADRSEMSSQADCVRSFLEGHYGQSPRLVTADHAAAHSAFERSVHPDVKDVLMIGQSRAVCSSASSSTKDHLDRDFPVVGFVGLCAEILGLGGRRIHHLENMAQYGEPTYLPQLKELMVAGHESPALRAHLYQLIELDSGDAGASPTSGHFDAAASLQRLLEDEVFELLESIGVHENDKLILCGGVFNSWSLNDAVVMFQSFCKKVLK